MMNNRGLQRRVKFGAVIMVAWVTGCSTMTRELPKPGDPFWAPVAPPSQVHPVAANGSIFAASRNSGMFEDRLAHQVGDVLTVLLEEKTQSKKSSGANIKKDSKMNLASPGLLGAVLSENNLDMLTEHEQKRNFSGNSGADQSNSLQGSITVTVAEVLPNGVLRVRGEKWITLNQGDEFIRLTGLIRPQDIGIDNAVPSNKIADARIAYSGTGQFANASNQGWLGKFFNSEWWPL
jgi:flagellar L-ring protein FlgH